MATYRFSARLCTLLPPEILRETWPLAQTILRGSKILAENEVIGPSDLEFVNFLSSPNSAEQIKGLCPSPMKDALLALVGRETELRPIYDGAYKTR
jgi:hypothetical protein